MSKWDKFMDEEKRFQRKTFSRSLLLAVDEDCLTRKARDAGKRKLMRQLGLPERYPEVGTASSAGVVEEE